MIYPIDHMAELWRRQGHPEQNVRLLVKQEEAKRTLRGPLTGQFILNRASVLMDGGCTTLTFLYWHGSGDVAGTDNAGRRYVVIGTYVGAEYSLKAMVCEKRKGKYFNWLGNGQAATNAKQALFLPGEERIAIPGVTYADITCANGLRIPN